MSAEMPGAAMPVDARAVARTYGGRSVLEGFSLTVPPGCVAAIVGPGGSGKSTALRILAGLIRPSGGSAKIFGIDVRSRSTTVQRRLVFLPSDRRVAGEISAARFLRYYGGFFDDWSATRPNDLLAAWGIRAEAPLGSLPPSLRSLAVLAALLGRTSGLLILDDPTEDLDPQLAADVLGRILEWTNGQRSVVMASNRLDEVERIADTVTVLGHGRVMLSGDLEHLRGQCKRIGAISAPPSAEIERWPGVWQVSEDGRRTTITTRSRPEDVVERLRLLGARHVEPSDMNLREIYLSATEGKRRVEP